MSSEILSKFLSRFIKIGLYAALLMPFIYIDNLIFPFVTGKVFIFQILIEILLAAYLLLIYLDKSFLPKRSFVLISVCLFVLSLIVSTVFSYDFDRSFWGNYERMSGSFSVLHFIAYFFILTGVLRSPTAWKRYLTAAVATSGIQAVIGIAQYFSTNLLLTRGGGRIWGTLGNYIYLATYAIFHIFIGAVLLTQSKDGLSSTKRQWFKSSIGILISLNIIILYLSGTRGGYLGFLAGLGLTALLFIFWVPSKKTRTISISIIILLALLLGLARVYRQNKLVQNFPILGPIANLNIKADTGFTRLISWGIAVKGWQEKPILGWGPENFYYAFNKYFDPRSLERGYYETWFDRPHNIVFDVLSTQGALGLVAYLAIFVSFILAVRKAWREETISGWHLSLALGGMGAYFVQNLFVFDQPSSFLLFFIMAAYFHSLVDRERKSDSILSSEVKIRSSAYLAVLLGIIVLYLAYTGTLKPWRAGVANIKAERVLAANFDQAFALYERAARFETPYQDDIQMSLARILHEQAGADGAFIKANEDKVKSAINHVQEVIKDHPNDVYPFMALSQLYGLLAIIDPQYFTPAEEAIEKAATLSPQRQQVYFVWARYKVMQKDYARAHELIQKTIDFNPQVSETHWYQALIYNSEGNDAKALEYMKEARKHGYNWKTTTEAFLFGRLLEGAGDFEDIPQILREIISLDPKAENYVFLARAYERIGKKEEAERALGRAIEMDPNVLQRMQN